MMIDVTAKVLPGADGGCKNKEEAAVCLRQYCEMGIGAVVATPYYTPSRTTISRFATARRRAVGDFASIYNKDMPKVYMGAEVLVDERLNTMPDIYRLAVDGTRLIIADMPQTEWDSYLIDVLSGLVSSDFDVLIAHLNRHPIEYAESLFALGFVGQLDISAFSGFGGIKNKKRYLNWIDNGYIVSLGDALGGECDKPPERLWRVLDILGDDRTQMLAEKTAKRLAGARPYPRFIESI